MCSDNPRISCSATSRSASMATSVTQSLVQLIVDGVKSFEETCAKRGVSYPTPDVLSSPETDAIQSELSHATAPIIAAAEQLVAVLTHPQPYLYGMSKWVRAKQIGGGGLTELSIGILPRCIGCRGERSRT